MSEKTQMLLDKIAGLVPSLDNINLGWLNSKLEDIIEEFQYCVYPAAPKPRPKEIVKIDIITDERG